MADFPTLLASSVFDFQKHYVPHIKSQTMQHALVNLLNTTLFQKYVDPQLELSIYGSVLQGVSWQSEQSSLALVRI